MNKYTHIRTYIHNIHTCMYAYMYSAYTYILKYILKHIHKYIKITYFSVRRLIAYAHQLSGNSIDRRFLFERGYNVC